MHRGDRIKHSTGTLITALRLAASGSVPIIGDTEMQGMWLEAAQRIHELETERNILFQYVQYDPEQFAAKVQDVLNSVEADIKGTWV